MSLHFCYLQFSGLMLLVYKFIFSRRIVHSNSSSTFLSRLPFFVLCLLSLKFNKFNLKIWAFLQTLIQYLIFINNLTIFHSKVSSRLLIFYLTQGQVKGKFSLIFLSSITTQNEICIKGHRLRKTLQEIVGIFQDNITLFCKGFHRKALDLSRSFKCILFIPPKK